MKTIWERIAAAGLALTLALPLAACGESGSSGKVNEEKATALVQGNLDEIYLGKFDPDYLELVDITENEAEETYLEGLEVEAETFMYYFNIEYPTDELKEEIIELYKKIYATSKYTVNPATKLDDNTFAVKVEVEPIDIVQLVNGEWDKTTEKFYEKYPSEVQRAMSRSEYQAMDKEWAALILKAFQDKLPEIGNMTPQSIVVSLEKDEDGYYSLNEKDFAALDALIIDYTSTIGGKS